MTRAVKKNQSCCNYVHLIRFDLALVVRAAEQRKHSDKHEDPLRTAVGSHVQGGLEEGVSEEGL